jgi:hypothetical protein
VQGSNVNVQPWLPRGLLVRNGHALSVDLLYEMFRKREGRETQQSQPKVTRVFGNSGNSNKQVTVGLLNLQGCKLQSRFSPWCKDCRRMSLRVDARLRGTCMLGNSCGLTRSLLTPGAPLGRENLARLEAGILEKPRYFGAQLLRMQLEAFVKGTKVTGRDSHTPSKRCPINSTLRPSDSACGLPLIKRTPAHVHPDVLYDNLHTVKLTSPNTRHFCSTDPTGTVT